MKTLGAVAGVQEGVATRDYRLAAEEGGHDCLIT